MSVAEQQRFVNVIQQMLNDPSNPYGKMVAVHGVMGHNMHGGMNAAGTQRFLGWHRTYLLQLEKMMQQIDSQAFIPYWDWVKHHSIPKWMTPFRPSVFVPGRGTIVVKRTPLPANQLPTATQVNTIMAATSYTTFTDTMENGPHGQVHMWFTRNPPPLNAMSDIRISPADPIFWLHHAQIDRLWSQWQVANPGKNPTLSGANATFDPWTQTETQVRSITALDYQYQ